VRKLDRGDWPDGYKTIYEAELALARLYFEGTGRTNGFDFNAYGNHRVKAALSKMGEKKCAYCEKDYDATQPVDVEHFRPKGAVEGANGRIQPAYWWLAADWTNLLPSCIRCNREETQPLYDGTLLKTGKGERFPLADETKRADAIDGEKGETPLLIDPSIEDPADYIAFVDSDEFCIAVPVDPDPASLSFRRGRASIDIYGLNRQGLVEKRSAYRTRARARLATLRRKIYRLDALDPDDAEGREDVSQDIDEALGELRAFLSGADLFTGMLTALIEPELREMNFID
jgi:uncharacterized protein (TIGR02646 family)